MIWHRSSVELYFQQWDIRTNHFFIYFDLDVIKMMWRINLVWPDLAEFHHFWKIKKSWAKFGRIICYSGNFEPRLANFKCYWHILIVVNDQILKINFAMWSPSILVERGDSPSIGRVNNWFFNGLTPPLFRLLSVLSNKTILQQINAKKFHLHPV